MKNYASGRIEIMAGGGVNSSNIQSLIEIANPDAIHFSGTKKFLLDEESMFSETVLKVDESKVSRIIDAINKIV
jgi:copper homeostasis protein CutC